MTFGTAGAAVASLMVALGACRAPVSERDGGAGVQEPGRMCTMEAWILAPHASRDANTELPSSAGAGRYRVVIVLTREGETPPAERVRAESPALTIAP